jgi:hypothetical protein
VEIGSPTLTLPAETILARRPPLPRKKPSTSLCVRLAKRLQGSQSSRPSKTAGPTENCRPSRGFRRTSRRNNVSPRHVGPQRMSCRLDEGFDVLRFDQGHLVVRAATVLRFGIPVSGQAHARKRFHDGQ